MKKLLVKINNRLVDRHHHSRLLKLLNIEFLENNGTGEVVQSIIHMMIVEIMLLLDWHKLTGWTIYKTEKRVSGPTAVSVDFVVEYTVYDKAFDNEEFNGSYILTANNEDEAYKIAELDLSERFNDEVTSVQIDDIRLAEENDPRLPENKKVLLGYMECEPASKDWTTDFEIWDTQSTCLLKANIDCEADTEEQAHQMVMHWLENTFQAQLEYCDIIVKKSIEVPRGYIFS